MPVRVEPMMVTTATELPGYRIVRNFGIVRGIIVRSRSLLGSIGAGLQTIVGGNITLLTELCEKTREDAYELMLQHAAEHGANAVVNMRYDATEIMQGVTEVLAYGTAVRVRGTRFRSGARTVAGSPRSAEQAYRCPTPGRTQRLPEHLLRKFPVLPKNLRAAGRAWSSMDGSSNSATRPTKGGSSSLQLSPFSSWLERGLSLRRNSEYNARSRRNSRRSSAVHCHARPSVSISSRKKASLACFSIS